MCCVNCEIISGDMSHLVLIVHLICEYIYIEMAVAASGRRGSVGYCEVAAYLLSFCYIISQFIESTQSKVWV